MNVKKFVLAWVAAVVVTFLLAGLWHLFLLADFYEVQTQAVAREEPKMPFIILGHLILGFLMALYESGRQVAYLWLARCQERMLDCPQNP